MNLLSSHGLVIRNRSYLRSHSPDESTNMMNSKPRPSMKLDDSYPAWSKFWFIGPGSALNENTALIASVQSMTSKLVKCMISIIIRLQFCGMLPVKRAVSVIICRVLIRPHRYWITPTRKMLSMKLDPRNDAKKPPVICSASTIRFSYSGVIYWSNSKLGSNFMKSSALLYSTESSCWYILGSNFTDIASLSAICET